MSNAFDESWVSLSKKDDEEEENRIFRKRPILGNRILVPIKEKQEEEHKRNEDIKHSPQHVSSLIHSLPRLDGKPNPPNPMDAAMEEIRAAQAQREAHAKQLEEQAKKFEDMMSGSFASAFPQNISQEMADMIAAYKLQGMSNEQATELARQQMGE